MLALIGYLGSTYFVAASIAGQNQALSIKWCLTCNECHLVSTQVIVILMHAPFEMHVLTSILMDCA